MYFFDLVWKLIHWSQFFGDVSGWALLMAFGIRIAVLAFLVSQYQLAGQRLLQEADSSK
ncbi:MAG: hypothetical protein LAP61_22100 [Acidobacteriia bacterium]|nr:hypothetical protein [Terriglobia bacterium]